MRLFLVIACLSLTGCQLFHRSGSIKSGGVTVQAQPDAGKPATLNTLNAGESVNLMAGSRVVITKYKAVPAKPATKDSPAVAAQPEREVTEIFPAGDTTWQRKEERVNADSGTVDTSIAMKKIEAAESRVLLYVSIAAALAAGFFVWASYPTPAIACGVASVTFFMAWKLSDLPDWFWAVGAIAGAAGIAIYLGHERGEKAKISTGTTTHP